MPNTIEAVKLPSPYTVSDIKRIYEESFGGFGGIEIVTYIGHYSKSHIYSTVMFNDNEGNWIVSKLFIFLGQSGKIEVDFSAMPEHAHEFDDEDDAIAAAKTFR